MTQENRFAVILLRELKWPTSLQWSGSRFRLFVAGDFSNVGIVAVSEFASTALSRGMVYFCAWGSDCERFHDIVDEVLVKDEIGKHAFAGPSANDTVMTTWHEHETLEQALDFFVTSAVPTQGFAVDSSFRVVMCLRNSDWAETATRVLQAKQSFL
jgi:hypothetical protein